MDDRKRRIIAAGILVLSLLIVAFLLFFTPSETNVVKATPTPAVSDATPVALLFKFR